MKKTLKSFPSQISYLITGLGNPSPLYNNTRHNIVKELKVVMETFEEGQIGFYKNQEGNVALFIPKCFMNISGRPIRKVFVRAKLSQFQNLLVVHDDLDSRMGQVKIKEGGSATGHNGLKSIIQQFNGESSFPRLKLGIDRPNSKEPGIVSEYVLDKFDKDQIQVMQNQTFPNALKLLRQRGFL